MKSSGFMCSILIGAALAPRLASATQLDYTLYSGILHSDNIDLSPQQPTSQNVFVPGLNFTLTQLGSTVQASVIGNLEYRDYLGNGFSNQTFAQTAGVVNWTLSPQRLDLTAADYAGVQPVAALAADAPSNQQQTNVFVVGPTLHLRLGPVASAQAVLHYINTYAQKTSEFNSSRGDAELQLIRALSPTSQISASASSERVHFTDSTGGPDYTNNSVYGRYASRLKQFTTDVVLGWSRLNFNGGATASDPLVRITAGYQPTLQSKLTLNLLHELTDAAQTMIVPADQISTAIASNEGIGGGLGPSPAIATGNSVINSQTFLQRSAEVTYTYNAGRVTYSLTPSYTTFRYQNNSTLNQTGHGLSAGLSYRLRPLLTLSAFANGANLDYQNLQRRDRLLNYGLSLRDRRTLHWSWQLSVSHRQRSSTAPGQDYRENEIYLGVLYRR